MGWFGLVKKDNGNKKNIPAPNTPEEDLEVSKILDAHQLWLKSDGEEGKQADFSNRCLDSFPFLTTTKLKGIIARDAVIRGIDFSGKGLSGVDFTGADLSNCNFSKCDLHDAKFHESILHNAYFAEAKYLQTRQFAGADVTLATLPDHIKEFDGLKEVANLVSHASKLYAWLIIACAYTWLTVATTTDLSMVTNSSTDPLPIIQTRIPTVWVYRFVPLILFSLFLYFQIYMQRIWGALATLPAIFPDGAHIDTKISSWMPLVLVRKSLNRLNRKKTDLGWFRDVLVATLTYWLVPVTMLALWLRYLTKQDLIGTFWHIVTIFCAFSTACIYLSLKAGAFDSGSHRSGFLRIWYHTLHLIPFSCFVALLVLSYGAIYGVGHKAFLFIDVESAIRSLAKEQNSDEPLKFPVNLEFEHVKVWPSPFSYDTSPPTISEEYDPRSWVPQLFDRFGYKPSANLIAQEISKRPKWWENDKKTRLS